MHKRKKYRKTLNEVGKQNYNFDYDIEKNIYAYLCCKHVKKKALKEMSENVKFDSYMEWKQYICNKCIDYSDEKLVEFSRYLNQRLRNVKPSREYWNLVVPVILSVIITKFPEMLETIQAVDLSGVSVWFVIIFIVILLAMMIPAFYCIWCMVTPIWDNCNEENLLVDYKEVVDSLIEERRKKKGL